MRQKLAVGLLTVILVGCTKPAGEGPGPATKVEVGPTPAPARGPQVELGVAYGTEKRDWLKWAVEEFAQTTEGARIKVNLLPMGSQEAAQAIWGGDKRIHVWSPASALYRDVLVQEWQAKQGGEPFLKEERLALTPMVFVMWEERHQAFLKKYATLDFTTIGKALAEKGGWDTIAAKPDWGLFKFGHTHPNQSNSGLMTLLLMAHEFHHRPQGLTLKEIVDVPFQDWMGEVERGVTGMTNSTGNMMQELVLKGPSSYDVAFVYENTAIDFLKRAEGRWGPIRIVYPKQNLWNDNPYYVLNAPWSSPAQREAAQTFLAYLLSEPIQRQALTHGFRPANVNVPVNFPESPFEVYEKYGLKARDLGTICDPPRAEVVTNLLAGWLRRSDRR